MGKLRKMPRNSAPTLVGCNVCNSYDLVPGKPFCSFHKPKAAKAASKAKSPPVKDKVKPAVASPAKAASKAKSPPVKDKVKPAVASPAKTKRDDARAPAARRDRNSAPTLVGCNVCNSYDLIPGKPFCSFHKPKAAKAASKAKSPPVKDKVKPAVASPAKTKRTGHCSSPAPAAKKAKAAVAKTEVAGQKEFNQVKATLRLLQEQVAALEPYFS